MAEETPAERLARGKEEKYLKQTWIHEHNKFLKDYSFIKRLIEDGSNAHFKQSLVDALYCCDIEVPKSVQARLSIDITKSLEAQSNAPVRNQISQTKT